MNDRHLARIVIGGTTETLDFRAETERIPTRGIDVEYRFVVDSTPALATRALPHYNSSSGVRTKQKMTLDRKFEFCVAPMMDWTDRHCRAFHRLLSKRARLYTEMVTTGAVIHGDRTRLLGFDPGERPVALQLGGSQPEQLAIAARIGADLGYDEINLNVGCPSDRVQNGAFGACLMREPALVADCVAAMKAKVAVPVTVKCRIGVDDQDPEIALDTLAEAVVAAGCDALIVHARKAWLNGLSPKENRSVPPLDYGRVRRLKHRFPEVPIVLNGGLTSIEAMKTELAHVDGVMVGRTAYQDPAILLEVDHALFGDPPPFEDTLQAFEAFTPYISMHLAEGIPLHAMARHMLGLFNGRRGARAWRRHLATEGVEHNADLATLRAAFAHVAEASAADSYACSMV